MQYKRRNRIRAAPSANASQDHTENAKTANWPNGVAALRAPGVGFPLGDSRIAPPLFRKRRCRRLCVRLRLLQAHQSLVRFLSIVSMPSE